MQLLFILVILGICGYAYYRFNKKKSEKAKNGTPNPPIKNDDPQGKSDVVN